MCTHYFRPLVGLALICALVSGCSRSKPLVVVTYGGGAYRDSHVKAFLQPFEAAEHVKTESVVWGAEYGRLAEMVRSKEVEWDVVEVTAAQFARGRKDGLFATMNPPVDASVFEPIPDSPSPDATGVPNVYWSTVLAFKSGAFPTDPATWADFWDTTRFPGPRALYDDPRATLEFALLADGVPLAQLYPLDLDRAFAKLTSIKPRVRVWWSDSTEPVRLLLTGQVSMTTAWSGRIYASQDAKNKIAYSWIGAAHELDYWIIPAGSRKVDLASSFVRFASSPDPMARQAELTAYGPANQKALVRVDSLVLPNLPTAPQNWSKGFVVNAAWWSLNEEAVTARWIKWRNQ